MLGVVLCGGQSLRMGSDKGLLIYRDKPWVKIAVDKLSQPGMNVSVSVNPSQYHAYTVLFPADQLIVDNSTLEIKGPLLGILSAHLSAPDQDIFVLASDMLLMEERLLKKLLDIFENDQTFEAYIFTREDQEEPLCGIYRSAALRGVMQMLAKGELTKVSMKSVLAQLQVLEVALKKEDYLYFSNFNADQDKTIL
jgi:molybdopterin-guanine dinucleotide biosynthesis protein A